jgi:hypothetical protein
MHEKPQYIHDNDLRKRKQAILGVLVENHILASDGRAGLHATYCIGPRGRVLMPGADAFLAYLRDIDQGKIQDAEAALHIFGYLGYMVIGEIEVGHRFRAQSLWKCFQSCSPIGITFIFKLYWVV